jgi:bifunctional non-homologous end joining protein LigD
MKPGKPATRDHHPAKRRSPPLPRGGARGVPPRLTSAPAATEGRVSRSERGGARGVPPRLTSAPAATEGRVSRSERPAGRGEGKTRGRLELPRDAEDVELRLSGRSVRLTNLKKLFWPELGLTKRDLLQYYADVSPALLPHLKDRAMVMKRYPHGASGEFFFMKRAPTPRPDWIEICSIAHASGNVIDFPMVQDLASLLWVVNLGCIDLNQWYARCDDVDRPDYLHFDLDPVPGADFQKVIATALLLRESLDVLKMPNSAKTTGSKGIHVYVPIVRGPTQKQVWTFAKEFARQMEARDPALVTAEYKIAKRPKGRVLVDYNQNAWGKTLASIYSVRPRPRATVSTPVTWKEIEKGVAIEDFRMDNVPARVAKQGDLWKPLLSPKSRFRLETFF